ncbi:MAG: hypothetical protein J6R12_03185 [Bacteroidales bacterium]|nr:hypothetical protein [Bacteroidales bacterium]
MGGNYKINEYGEIIRNAETPNDLAGYEDALLRGESSKPIFEGKLLKRLAMKRFYGYALEILQ